MDTNRKIKFLFAENIKGYMSCSYCEWFCAALKSFACRVLYENSLYMQALHSESLIRMIL